MFSYVFMIFHDFPSSFPSSPGAPKTTFRQREPKPPASPATSRGLPWPFPCVLEAHHPGHAETYHLPGWCIKHTGVFTYGSYMGQYMDNLWKIYMGSLWIIYGSGWWYTYPSEKYQSIGMIIPNIWENNTCSKPPTSLLINGLT